MDITRSRPKVGRALKVSLLHAPRVWAAIFSNVFERFVAEAKAPKSIAPPMKSGSFMKLAFNHEKMLKAEGSEGNYGMEPPNCSSAPT